VDLAKRHLYCSGVCHAWCCRFIVVEYTPFNNETDEAFFKLRNITVDREHGKLIIPLKCNWLNNRNECKLYRFRPESCKSFECEALKKMPPILDT